MNTKAMGLMAQVAKGLLKHGECRTVAELGDRSLYVGLSDIGKGAECLRSAVTGRFMAVGIRLRIRLWTGIRMGSLTRSWRPCGSS